MRDEGGACSGVEAMESSRGRLRRGCFGLGCHQGGEAFIRSGKNVRLIFSIACEREAQGKRIPKMRAGSCEVSRRGTAGAFPSEEHTAPASTGCEPSTFVLGRQEEGSPSV